MEGRKQFTFYRSYYEALQMLPKEQWADVVNAIIAFALDGEEPAALNDQQQIIYVMARPSLSASRSKAMSALNNKEKNKEKEKIKSKSKLKSKSKDNSLGDGEGFETFWEAYPLKVGKAKALQSWHTVKPDLEEALQGLMRWKASSQWEREDGRFIPRAWRWLEEKQYLDHPEPGKRPIYGASGVLGQAELESIRQVMDT